MECIGLAGGRYNQLRRLKIVSSSSRPTISKADFSEATLRNRSLLLGHTATRQGRGP